MKKLSHMVNLFSNLAGCLVTWIILILVILVCSASAFLFYAIFINTQP